MLFALNSDQLQPEGRQVLKGLAQPIAAYLGASGQMLIVGGGFADDMPVRGSNRHFADNWELSAQRALTVTRTLIRGRRALLGHLRRRLRFAAAGGRQHRR